MDYEHIYDWSAQRAGAHITVTGKALDGQPRKITKVAYISHSDGRVLAVRDDATFVLALGRVQ